MTVLDKGSQNPRIQCGECGQWKRLHGKDKDGREITRFYGSCEVTKGDHPCGKEVCSECCPAKCRERIQPSDGGVAGEPVAWREERDRIIDLCAVVAEGFDGACNSRRMKPFVDAGLELEIYKRDNEIGAAIRELKSLALPLVRESLGLEALTEDQIKHMVDRFLGWRLPENFNPNGGIDFKKFGNKGTFYQYEYLPSGTNLFDARQADAMVRYLIEGLFPLPPVPGNEGRDSNRCPICDWPFAESPEKGCVPGDCSYRPEDPAEQERIRKRREAIRGLSRSRSEC